MKKNSALLIILVITGSVLVLAFAGWGSARANGEIQPEATATPGMQPIDDKIGVIIDLPAGSTQKEIGKEVYRLTCSACHAYDGSGLTDAWRATWNPADQNCWQSKCHGYNHPDDGFYLPDSPAIVGSFFPQLFPTAADLYAYINLTMPWHDPGVLPPDQAWAVTAHVLVLNGFDPGEDLNPNTAANFRLLPEGVILPTFTAVATQQNEQVFIPLAETTAPTSKTEKKPAYLLYAIIGLTLLSGIGWLISRKTGK
jgi:cytochrome c5